MRRHFSIITGAREVVRKCRSLARRQAFPHSNSGSPPQCFTCSTSVAFAHDIIAEQSRAQINSREQWCDVNVWSWHLHRFAEQRRNHLSATRLRFSIFLPSKCRPPILSPLYFLSSTVWFDDLAQRDRETQRTRLIFAFLCQNSFKSFNSLRQTTTRMQLSNKAEQNFLFCFESRSELIGKALSSRQARVNIVSVSDEVCRWWQAQKPCRQRAWRSSDNQQTNLAARRGQASEARGKTFMKLILSAIISPCCNYETTEAKRERAPQWGKNHILPLIYWANLAEINVGAAHGDLLAHEEKKKFPFHRRRKVLDRRAKWVNNEAMMETDDV